MTPIDFERPLFSLSVAEWIELQKNVSAPVQLENLEKKRIKGIKGLALELSVSVPTVQGWKNNGIIRYSQVGRSIFFDLNQVIEDLAKYKPDRYGKR